MGEFLTTLFRNTQKSHEWGRRLRGMLAVVVVGLWDIVVLSPEADDGLEMTVGDQVAWPERLAGEWAGSTLLEPAKDGITLEIVALAVHERTDHRGEIDGADELIGDRNLLSLVVEHRRGAWALLGHDV